MDFIKPRIAIIQDALVVSGGSERVAAALCQIFPEADLITSVFLPDKTYPFFKNIKVKTLPGSSLIKSEKHFKKTYPIWLLGFYLLNLSKYDIVITSSSYASKFIRKPKNGFHICYLHNPIRFVWNRESYKNTSLPFNNWIIKFIDIFIPLLKKIDFYFTRKIDIIISNSRNMANKIKKVYDKEAIIIYPPIDIKEFHNDFNKKDYYLYVGRLLSYKRIDLAITACKKLKKKLIIVGIGPEYEELKKISNELIEFKGLVDEDYLHQLYSEAKGLLFTGKEDFGLVPVEAQASGCGVIAYGEGGALETVKDGLTGIFFDKQDEEEVINAIKRYELLNFDIEKIKENANQFDISKFSIEINKVINDCWKNC